MRDCFIEALDPDLALKLREKEVPDLDQALSTALVVKNKMSHTVMIKAVTDMHEMLLSLGHVMITLTFHCCLR